MVLVVDEDVWFVVAFIRCGSVVVVGGGAVVDRSAVVSVFGEVDSAVVTGIVGSCGFFFFTDVGVFDAVGGYYGGRDFDVG